MKVIYILGWGHSGSTLLDLLIGSSSKVVSLGEIIFLNYYARGIRHQKVLRPFDCTCGAPFSDCRFWRSVDRLVDLPRKNVVYDDNGNGGRLVWLFRYLAFRLSGGRLRPPTEALGDDEAIFQAVLQNAPADTEYLCDSSKDFARFARLAMMPGIEVLPVFLVRDARAVSHSYTKKKREQLGLNRMTAMGAATRWLFINTVCRTLIALHGRPFVQVSYDQFCANPAGTIDTLNSIFGLNIDRDDYLDGISGTTYHNVGGNLVRFKAINRIVVDDSWRKLGNGFSGSVIGVVCWPFNKAWVFRKS